MLFWLACEDLKQEINKGTVEEKVRAIYEDYVSILSPKEVGESVGGTELLWKSCVCTYLDDVVVFLPKTCAGSGTRERIFA